MSAAPSDLEKRIEALMLTIDRERVDRRNEAAAAAAKIQELESKLQANSNKAAATRAPASPTRRSPSTKASPVKASPSGVAKPSADATTGDVPPQSAASRFSQRKPAAAATTTAKPEPKKAAQVDTAPQHAWDKFCVHARNQFTVRDLSLVSQDTLRALLAHYNINDPVECAQIECQWALMQEGKQAVEEPTIHKPVSMRAKSFEPVKHKAEFDLRNGPSAPKLSKRVLLNPEEERPSNPNASVERRRSVSPGSKGAIHIDPLQGCNPNDSVSPGPCVRGKRTWMNPPSTIYRDDRRPEGKGRSHSPVPQPIQCYPQRDGAAERGVKRFSRQESPESHNRGLKTGYPRPSATRDKHSLRVLHSGGGPVQFAL